MSGLLEWVREWWDAADSQERYYALIIAATILGILAQSLPAHEQRIRVKHE